jgi:hypothetical protein
MDELVEQLEEMQMSSPHWLGIAKQLRDVVHHHLQEEEQRFFQQAGKILTAQKKQELAEQYLNEYQKYKIENA